MVNSSRTRRLTAAGILCLLCAAGATKPAQADAPSVMRFAALSYEDAETVAVATSPDVAIARANVDAAGAALAQARGTNGLSLLIGYVEQPQSGGVPNLTWAQRLGTYQLQATLGDMAALSPLVAQASVLVRQAVADELAAERTERLKVITLYFAALQTRAVSSAKRDAIGDAEGLEQDASDRYGSGKLSYADLLRAQVSLAKARADAAEAQSIDANATDALAREIGRSPDDLRDLIPEPQLQATVIGDDQAIARAFAQRPELRSADRAVDAAEFGLAAARRAVIPPITLAGGYVNGVDSGTVIGGPALTVSMQIPLSGIAGARVAAQEAGIRIATARRDGIKRALALEVGAAARSASAAIISRAETEASLEAATSYLRYATRQFKATRNAGMLVKEATDVYSQALVDDIAAEYAVLQAQAALNVELSP